MKKMTIIIIALLIVLAVAIGVYALTKDDNGESSSTNTTNTTNTTDPSEPPGDTEPVEGATIAYTDNGFSPETIEVMSGATITVINESSDDLQFSSNQHPVHTDNEELNQTTLAPGERQSFVVDEKGTWGYHNHLNASDMGTIIVE